MADPTTQTGTQTALLTGGDVFAAIFDGVAVVDPQRRIRQWNRAAEEISGISAGEAAGRPCCDEIFVHVQCEESACPLDESLRDGQTRERELFVRHAGGHMIPVQCRIVPIHGPSGEIEAAAKIFRPVTAAEGEDPDRNRESLFLDPQTQVASRRYLEMRLMSRFEEMQRFGWTFGVVIASVDGAEQICRSHGEKARDRLMQAVVKTFAAGLRNFDTVGRWSENEFMAVVPVLEYGQLWAVSERIRQVIEKARLFDGAEGEKLSATVSVGSAAPEQGESIVDVVQRALQNMVSGRQAGGNRVVF
jgi:diguanylate cyclase (GGDEF)-like protein/PAS domain S-box-containing protein